MTPPKRYHELTMNETEAIEKIRSAIRRLECLSSRIALGDLHSIRAFNVTRDRAYSEVRWLASASDRDICNSAIDAVPLTSAIEAGQAMARERTLARATVASRNSRAVQPTPGYYRFELEMLRSGR